MSLVGNIFLLSEKKRILFNQNSFFIVEDEKDESENIFYRKIEEDEYELNPNLLILVLYIQRMVRFTYDLKRVDFKGEIDLEQKYHLMYSGHFLDIVRHLKESGRIEIEEFSINFYNFQHIINQLSEFICELSDFEEGLSGKSVKKISFNVSISNGITNTIVIK